MSLMATDRTCSICQEAVCHVEAGEGKSMSLPDRLDKCHKYRKGAKRFCCAFGESPESAILAFPHLSPKAGAK